MAFQLKDGELGALWIKQGPRGEYLTGEIGGVKVVCFRETNKRSEKAPDWRVMKSQPREPKPAQDDPEF